MVDGSARFFRKRNFQKHEPCAKASNILKAYSVLAHDVHGGCRHLTSLSAKLQAIGRFCSHIPPPRVAFARTLRFAQHSWHSTFGLRTWQKKGLSLTLNPKPETLNPNPNLAVDIHEGTGCTETRATLRLADMSLVQLHDYLLQKPQDFNRILMPTFLPFQGQLLS